MDFFSVLPQQPFLRITTNTYNVSSRNGKIVNVILMVNLNIWIKEKNALNKTNIYEILFRVFNKTLCRKIAENCNILKYFQQL